MEVNTFDSSVSWYSERNPIYESLSKKVSEILEEIFCDLKINYHKIEWRAKTVESFRGKLIKGLDYDPRQMKDLAGIRVIAYVHSDLSSVRDVIKSICNYSATDKKVCFSAKCCNSQDNSGAPLSAARIPSMTGKPFFLIVEM